MLLLLALACADPADTDSEPKDSQPPESPVDTTPPEPFAFFTPAWEDGGEIPSAYTCDGDAGWSGQHNPELSWTDPPAGTAAFALVYVDLTLNDWRHWAFFTADAELSGLPEASSHSGALPDGVTELRSGDGRVGYVPNCPSGSMHTYEFTLWALSEPLSELDGRSTFAELTEAAEAVSLETLRFTGRSDAGG